MISDEAVEAALRKLFPQRAVSDFNRGVWTPTIKTILEAAAPYIKAEAWDEGAKAGADYEYRTALAFERCTLEELTPVTNPYRSQP
jgi:hypothetical protein